MQEEIERAAAPLVGRRITAIGRATNVVWLHFGDGGGDEAFALHVSCTWRLASPDGILAGAGDLFTPADPEADPDEFAWETPGATWFDVRARSFLEATAATPVAVERVAGDALGGLRVALGGGLALELFPESSPAEHVETEFWRLFRLGGDAPHFVVTSEGARRDVDEPGADA